MTLRQDVELLTDAGVLNIPVMTWPMSWGDLARALDAAELDPAASTAVTVALERLRARARDATAWGFTKVEYGLSLDTQPRRLRSFEETPREDAEASGRISYTGERIALRLATTFAANPSDDREVRFDGSYAGVVLGNTSISLGWQEKWWGPGWDGALALSTNARPIPGLLVKRNFSDAFETRWLNWIGPWTGSFFFGQLESDRGVPETKFVAGRLAFRPFRSLELGLTRTAQWGGEGRDESLDSFVDLLLGRDNVGDDGVDRDTEPGNQLAGYDWRWRVLGGERPVVFYGQLIGEDEAGGFPSRFLGQLGLSMSTRLGQGGASLRTWAEFSDTTCQFYESSKRFNCAYNNSLYPTGYRYRGRAIGHSSDNDARQFAVGASYVDAAGQRYTANLRYAELNRGGAPDEGNSLTSVPSDLLNVELTHERELFAGRLRVGVGVDAADGDPGGLDGTDVRVFLKWDNRL